MLVLFFLYALNRPRKKLYKLFLIVQIANEIKALFNLLEQLYLHSDNIIGSIY